MAVLGAQQQITEAVLTWAGMTAEPHRLAASSIGWGHARSATFTATTWSIFPFQPKDLYL